MKVQGTPRSISCIPWLLWTFRSLTPLPAKPYYPAQSVMCHQASSRAIEQAMHCHASPGTTFCCHASPSIAFCCHALPCITKCCLVLPCITKYCLVLPCSTMHHQVLPCVAMHYQVLPCAYSTRSWHCTHDHPPTCTSTECPIPPISFCSVHYL